MIEQFDGVKAQKFEDELRSNGYKNGLSSLVNLRNNIGHHTRKINSLHYI